MDIKQIWLKEYEICQQDIIDSSSRYWIIVSIFVGVSTAVLGVIATGIISSDFIKHIFQRNAQAQTITARVIIIVLGLGIIAVFYCLKKWLKRVNYLNKITYIRMLEIEFELGMWKNWMIHGVDHWEEIANEDKVRLVKYHPEGWWKRKGLKEYIGPNNEINFGILLTMIIVWAVIVGSTIISLCIWH